MLINKKCVINSNQKCNRRIMPKCTATMYSIFFNLLALFANIYHIAGKQEGVILSSVV